MFSVEALYVEGESGDMTGGGRLARLCPPARDNLDDMQDKKNNDRDIEKRNRGLALQAMGMTTAIGTELAFTVVTGYYCGRFLDRRFDTEPWLMLAGVIVGIAVGIAGICKILQRFFRERE